MSRSDFKVNDKTRLTGRVYGTHGTINPFKKVPKSNPFFNPKNAAPSECKVVRF